MFISNGGYFNCTIQELKRRRIDCAWRRLVVFQLHHTGIKTRDVLRSSQASRDFNCTIQELKHLGSVRRDALTMGFQLHHTGIKTFKVILYV